MRVLVCGGRDYWSADIVNMTLNACETFINGPIKTVIHGGCMGADRMAGEWADKNGVKTEVYPADWSKHGKKAGPLRNQRMIDDGKPDYVIAFPGGFGTADMVRRAKAAGIPVQKVDHALIELIRKATGQ